MSNESNEMTPALKRVLEIARVEANNNQEFVGVNHVLIAILLEGRNAGFLTLSDAGITVDQIRRNYVNWKGESGTLKTHANRK